MSRTYGTNNLPGSVTTVEAGGMDTIRSPMYVGDHKVNVFLQEKDKNTEFDYEVATEFDYLWSSGCYDCEFVTSGVSNSIDRIVELKRYAFGRYLIHSCEEGNGSMEILK